MSQTDPVWRTSKNQGVLDSYFVIATGSHPGVHSQSIQSSNSGASIITVSCWVTNPRYDSNINRFEIWWSDHLMPFVTTRLDSIVHNPSPLEPYTRSELLFIVRWYLMINQMRLIYSEYYIQIKQISTKLHIN